MKVYLKGANVFFDDGVNYYKPIPSHKLRFYLNKTRTHVYFDDDGVTKSFAVAVADIKNENDQSFAGADAVENYLTEFVGAFNVGGGGVGDQREGTTIVFDKKWNQAFYNSVLPSNSATLTIDEENPQAGVVRTFHNSGEVETIVNDLTTYEFEKSGVWQSGKLNLYHLSFDGTRFILNIQVLGDYLPPLPDPNILFSETFGGTTFDTVKWTKTNPNTTEIPITQNDALLFNSDASVSISSADNNVTSNPVFDVTSGTTVLSMELRNLNQDSYGGWGAGFSNGVSYIYIQYGASGTGNFIRVLAQDGATEVIAPTDILLSVYNYTVFKTLITEDETIIYAYDDVTEEWDVLASANHAWSVTDFKIKFQQGNNIADTNPLMVGAYKNIFVCDGNFYDKYPPNTI